MTNDEIGMLCYNGNTVSYSWDKLQNYSRQLGEAGNEIRRLRSQLAEQPQPAPQPELMTMAKAIAKAVEMGGGEVWILDKYKAATYDDLGLVFHIAFPPEVYHIHSDCIVRPLPPETLDFTEAMARLMRGESVQISGTGLMLHPNMVATTEDSERPLQAYTFIELAKMTFRAVVK